MYFLGTIDSIVALITLAILAHAKLKHDIQTTTHLISIFLIVATNTILYMNQNQTFTFIWAALLPIFPFLFVGKKMGQYLCIYSLCFSHGY